MQLGADNAWIRNVRADSRRAVRPRTQIEDALTQFHSHVAFADVDIDEPHGLDFFIIIYMQQEAEQCTFTILLASDANGIAS